jgi:hypothetical protein
MFGPSEPMNSKLTDLLVDTGPDKSGRKGALKALAACEERIMELAEREPLMLLAHDISPTQVSSRVVAITNRGVAALTRKKVDRYFTFGEIAETKLLRHERGIIVVVETYRARNDFLPNDYRRHEHIIQFFTATPGAANLVCAAIDPHLN